MPSATENWASFKHELLVLLDAPTHRAIWPGLQLTFSPDMSIFGIIILEQAGM